MFPEVVGQRSKVRWPRWPRNRFMPVEPNGFEDGYWEVQLLVCLIEAACHPAAVTALAWYRDEHLIVSQEKWHKLKIFMFHTEHCRYFGVMFSFVADPRTAKWPLMSSPFPTLAICLGYVYVVKFLGPRLMENRKPMELRKILVYYNLFQILFSMWLFLEVSFSNKGFSLTCELWTCVANSDFLAHPPDHSTVQCGLVMRGCIVNHACSHFTSRWTTADVAAAVITCF
jgi:hypothetical protein